MKRILVTGAAGFIGFHVTQRLLARGDAVLGIDNMNAYYNPQLKRDRLAQLTSHPAFTFAQKGLEDRQAMETLFDEFRPQLVVHLGAQAGVRYSLENPHAYADSNLTGAVNILENCRRHSVEHLVYASSSSVYGANTRMPFTVGDTVDHPISLYAATKKAMELMAHAYSHLFRIPSTGLRFFTVYGPWGRPDMALITFTKAIVAGEPIRVFNHGQMKRDFTYIDDVAEGVVRTLDRPATPAADWNGNDPDPATSNAPYRVYNIGNQSPVELLRLIELLEQALGRKAKLQFEPLQPGDVLETYADIAALERDVGYRPHTPIEEGIRRFVAWYVDYYQVARG